MTVTQNSLIDLPNRLAQARLPQPWTRLRQGRQPSTETGRPALAAEPTAATVDNAATLPSWPRIFPGL